VIDDNSNNERNLRAANYDLLNTVYVRLFNEATFISKPILQMAGLN